MWSVERFVSTLEDEPESLVAEESSSLSSGVRKKFDLPFDGVLIDLRSSPPHPKKATVRAIGKRIIICTKKME